MTVEEYLSSVKKCEIDETRKILFTKKFKKDINSFAMKMISYAKESVFVNEERRVLAYDEIVDFDLEYDFELEEYGIIPLIDCYDNDYIVYLVNEDKWAKFNTSDKCIFKKKNTVEELI